MKNVPEIYGHALNVSATEYVADAYHTVQTHMILQLVVALLGLTVMLVVWLMQSWSFTATVVEQLETLQVPHPPLANSSPLQSPPPTRETVTSIFF